MAGVAKLARQYITCHVYRETNHSKSEGGRTSALEHQMRMVDFILTTRRAE